MLEKVILIGGGGHCRSVLQALKRANVNVYGIVDNKLPEGEHVLGVRVLGGDAVLKEHAREACRFIVTVGSIRGGALRRELYEKIISYGYRPQSFVSEKAIVSEDVNIGDGTVVLDGAIVNTGTVLGRNCIINSGCIIEHDCHVGDHVHVAPGAVISGDVSLGENVFVGAGSVIKQGMRIGAGATIASGGVVIRDVNAEVTVAGVPARRIDK